MRGSAGVPLEEFGVEPDEPIHRRTRADVLEDDVDLMARAAEDLRKRSERAYRLDVQGVRGDGDHRQLVLTTSRLTRLNVYVNGNPVCASLTVDPAPDTVTTVDIQADDLATLQVAGFDRGAGPVAEAAGPIARFLPALELEQPANNEDRMAAEPFPDSTT